MSPSPPVAGAHAYDHLRGDDERSPSSSRIPPPSIVPNGTAAAYPGQNAGSQPASSHDETNRSSENGSRRTLVQDDRSEERTEGDKTNVLNTSPSSARRQELRDGEDGQDGGLAPRYSAGFLDPRLAPLRKQFYKTLFLGTFLIIVSVFAFLSIYWAALWKTPSYVPRLNGYLIDFDGAEIGQSVTQAFQEVSGSYDQMTWTIETRFADRAQVEEAIVENAAWAAVVINAGATANLNAAIANLDAAYNGSQAVYVYTNGARNQQATSYIMHSYTQPLMMTQQMFASQRASQLAGNPNLAAILTTVPQAVTLPMSYLNYDLRPFDVPVATAATYVGLIYVCIFAFVLVLQSYTARQPLIPYLNLRSHLFLRVITPLSGYLLLSIAYALVSYAFQVPFYRKFGSSGFVIYWMLCYNAMLALGYALESMITLLTPQFISFFLLLWIISNVAVVFYPIDMLPRVFHYGYAMPFLHFADATRTILFDTRNRLGLNFGVLIAWFVASVTTMCIFTTITHKLGLRKHKAELARRRQRD